MAQRLVTLLGAGSCGATNAAAQAPISMLKSEGAAVYTPLTPESENPWAR